MSNLILVIGESGTGKSTAIETLDPTETFIIQVINKPLPFKGYKSKYPLQTQGKKGSRFVTDNSISIQQILKSISNKDDYKHIKTVVIDDFQYILSNEFMARAMERGFDKFTEMAQHYYSIIETAQGLREDLNIIFLSHSERKDDGTVKVKTIGKLLDEKITIEGLFTIVLNTVIDNGNYYFETQNNGMSTSKSPKGMFKEDKIPNDLKLVVDKVEEYYE